jgi:hypothetical protein
MDVQEIAVSNSQRKKLLKAVRDDSVLFQDENGDVVVSVAAYMVFKEGRDPDPLEAIVGDGVLDFKASYFIFN